MISPLSRYPIRGVLWYQGESNTGDPALYRTLFPAMIDAWRDTWDQGDFPFLYVQLPGFLARHPQPTESRWAELREAQAQALSIAKTAMAVTIDLGEEHDMHPPDKRDVAHRLALLAESQVYGNSDVAAYGPVFPVWRSLMERRPSLSPIPAAVSRSTTGRCSKALPLPEKTGNSSGRMPKSTETR